MKAEFADAIAFAGGDRRTEDPAGLRTRSIEIAGTVLGIEGGTGLIIGKAIESLGRSTIAVQVQSTGMCIARKLRREARPRCRGTPTHTGSALRIFVLEGSKAFFQSQGVGRPDGKGSDAALRAARTAQEVWATAGSGIGKGAVNQGDEGAVLATKMRVWLVRIADEIGAHTSILAKCGGASTGSHLGNLRGVFL